MKIRKIQLPLKDTDIKKLKAGDMALLSGVVFTARDAAHKRIQLKIKNSKLKIRKLAINLKGQTVYYAGPAPAQPGKVIGSCGPTTSARMDAFTPALLGLGLKGMIGKGKRSEEVKKAIKKHKAVNFAAVGGTGALLAGRIKSAEVIAYKDLGTEAVRRLDLRDFPVVVAIDARGKSIYK